MEDKQDKEGKKIEGSQCEGENEGVEKEGMEVKKLSKEWKRRRIVKRIKRKEKCEKKNEKRQWIIKQGVKEKKKNVRKK